MLKYRQIKKVFTNLDELKIDGIWFSSKKGEGEHKKWWYNGQLFLHCYFKQNKKDGEYKLWYENGQLWIHCFYKQGNKIGEYKRWWSNGQLYLHSFYRDIESKYSVDIYQGEDDKRFKGEYKKWYGNGRLKEHIIFNNDGTVKEIIK